jgi:hypothetical protein
VPSEPMNKFFRWKVSWALEVGIGGCGEFVGVGSRKAIPERQSATGARGEFGFVGAVNGPRAGLSGSV